MMTKVLLVDDDALVRMFLRQIIPWETEGYTVVGDARDGEEALQLVAQTEPDVILADVSMPVMDGVELVRHLREQGYPGNIAMLSCHDDFAYVKNAMQLGADEYLLKNHLTPDTLRQTLQSLHRKRAPLPDTVPEKIWRKGQRSLRQEVFENLLSGAAQNQEETVSLREAGVTASCRTCAVVLARLPSDATIPVSNFLELCYQLESGGAGKRVWSARVGNHSCAFLLNLQEEPSMQTRQEQIDALCTRIENSITEYLQLRAAIGISSVCTGAYAVADALRQAEKAVLCSFYDPKPHQYGMPGTGFTDGIPTAAQQFLQNLHLPTDETQLRESFSRAIASFERAATMPGEVLHWLQSCDLAAGVVRPVRFYAELDSIRKYAPCVEAFVNRSKELEAQAIPSQLSQPVAAAVRYLHAHFREPVTLGEVAAQAGFHPSYFSSVFKQEMGKGFSEYLTGLRLDAVRAALPDSTDTIKKIAADAGFVDYQHFCKTFKKHFGMSPAAFRKQKQACF